LPPLPDLSVAYMASRPLSLCTSRFSMSICKLESACVTKSDKLDGLSDYRPVCGPCNHRKQEYMKGAA
jgi:hypothetical protein